LVVQICCFFMGRFLLLACAIMIIGCKDPLVTEYPVPSKKEINNVLRAVIDQQKIVIRYDSTGRVVNGADSVFTYNTLDSLPLTINLAKLNVDNYELGQYGITFDNLLDTTRPDLFKSADKSYLYFQNTILKGLKADRAAAPKSRFTNNTWLHNELRDNYKIHPFYNLSIPLFSQDQKKAYVQLETYFGFNLSEGYAFILNKINGRWYIVWQGVTWRS
jgi:hypothetical protein